MSDNDTAANPVLAIAANDSMLLVAPVDVLVEHINLEFRPQGPDDDDPTHHLDWEFCDARGLVYQAAIDAGSQKLTAISPDPGGRALTASESANLVDRLDAFQARVQVACDRFLADHPGALPFQRTPRITGELHDVVTALYAVCPTPPPEEPHPGSALHMLWHLVTGTH
jgi:hypothetical protein